MRRPRAGDERSSQALGRRRGSAWWPIRAACQELADGAAVEACPRFLPERPSEMTAIPVKTRRRPRIGKPRSRRCPESAARRRNSVYDYGRNGRKRPQMSPGIERCSGGAPGGASAFPQGDADIEPTTAAPPGAPSPRIRRGEGRRACPGPRQRIRAMALGCLKSESGIVTPHSCGPTTWRTRCRRPCGSRQA